MIPTVKALFYDTINGAPVYHLIVELFLCLWVLWLLKRKKKRLEDEVVLTPQEEEEVIDAWQPKPLVEGEHIKPEQSTWGLVESHIGRKVTIDGVEYLNLATENFLNLVEEKKLEEEAERCVRKYGVGSCGPRGFYGTVDVHLELEDCISKFLDLEETALYSYGFSTIASAIPSYAKAGDIIFADENVNFSIQKGLQASRSHIFYFKHNDVDDLRRLFVKQAEKDKQNIKKAKSIRRFCVVEGIYKKTGEMCPLKEITELCKEYKVRVFVDESISFGTVGKTGRGVTEYLDVPRKDIDFICGSLEGALGCFGGFIVGPSFVVDHQRISGLGYCFSASLPPLLAGTGIQAIKILENNPEYVDELQENCHFMHNLLSNLKYLRLSGHECSPIKHLTLNILHKPEQRSKEKAVLKEIVCYLKKNNVAIIQPSYLEEQEVKLCPPGIRLSVSRLLTKSEMNKVVKLLEEATASLQTEIDNLSS